MAGNICGEFFPNATHVCDKEDNYQDTFYYCVMKTHGYSLFQIETISVSKWFLKKLFTTNLICPIPLSSDNPYLLLR